MMDLQSMNHPAQRAWYHGTDKIVGEKVRIIPYKYPDYILGNGFHLTNHPGAALDYSISKCKSLKMDQLLKEWPDMPNSSMYDEYNWKASLAIGAEMSKITHGKVYQVHLQDCKILNLLDDPFLTLMRQIKHLPFKEHATIVNKFTEKHNISRLVNSPSSGHLQDGFMQRIALSLGFDAIYSVNERRHQNNPPTVLTNTPATLTIYNPKIVTKFYEIPLIELQQKIASAAIQELQNERQHTGKSNDPGQQLKL